ncbi:peroxiredoxin [Chitinimonas arctica]|uniref:thioredoxin-dependent peroxiredoxin n=1 Tax=Chitinimonas arctica TaxID=2594795 RepID=A0A516SCB1_9NEIS|nr:peroxiredoxin [Chitinimonas arctica]QDQ25786.1 peroxiredoxin [Chitinimonas arctica]
MKSVFLGLFMAFSLLVHADVTIGQGAPAFALTDQAGKVRTSDDFRGKWLVLYFYPKAETPGCTEEACSFRDDILLLRALGAEVVGVSTDDVATIREFGRKHELPFTLLADPDGKTSEKFGTLVNLGVMKFSRRHSFLIDPQGRVMKRYTDLETKTYAKTIIADLRALSGKS